MRNQIALRTIFMAGVASAGIAMLAFPTSAVAQPAERGWSIPRQDLDDALRAFALASGQDVVFDPAIVRGRRSTDLRGRHPVQEALRILLRNTGLVAQATASGGFAILVAGSPGAGEAQAAGAAAENEGAEQHEIVVTGTAIRGVAPASSPVTTYSRDAIERSGSATVDQFLRQLPSNFAQIDANTSQGTTGSGAGVAGNIARGANSGFGSSVDLLGLGPGATLSLLNGHRLAPTGTNGSLVDVSMIPLSAIDRVEILTGGASAIYGADAVAGVVNFILRRNYDGADVSVRYGAPTQGGGDQVRASATVGRQFGSSNALISYEFFDSQPIRVGQRDFIAILPGRGREQMLLPDQRRHSVFGAFNHSFSPQIEISVDGYYSQRQFSSQTDVPNIFRIGFSRGEAEAYGGNLSLSYDITPRWNIVATASRSESRLVSIIEQFNSGTLITPPASRLGVDNTRLTSGDILASGPLFALPGGPARLAVGGQWRWEGLSLSGRYGLTGTEFARNVGSLFGEVLLPIVGPENGSAGLRRLELSLAGRLDTYSDFGSALSPKAGLAWSPVDGLTFRTSYAASFRAPRLIELNPSPGVPLVLRLARPGGGTNATILNNASGNPDLEPERSRSFTAGFDVTPELLRGVRVSGTYFLVRYKDRISTPPVSGSVTTIWSQVDALLPFFNFEPTPSEISFFYSNPNFSNTQNIPQSDVVAIFDNRLTNLAFSRTTGLEGSISYSSNIGQANILLNGSFTHLLGSDFKATTITPVVSGIDQLFLPSDFRARGGFNVSLQGLSFGATVNYVEGYPNRLIPGTRVSSWATVDARLAYRAGQRDGRFLNGFSFALNISNLFDSSPPRFAIPVGQEANFYGFDPTNASIVGRFISFQIGKAW